jgi:hypothetical protein
MPVRRGPFRARGVLTNSFRRVGCASRCSRRDAHGGYSSEYSPDAHGVLVGYSHRYSRGYSRGARRGLLQAGLRVLEPLLSVGPGGKHVEMAASQWCARHRRNTKQQLGAGRRSTTQQHGTGRRNSKPTNVPRNKTTPPQRAVSGCDPLARSRVSRRVPVEYPAEYPSSIPTSTRRVLVEYPSSTRRVPLEYPSSTRRVPVEYSSSTPRALGCAAG